MGTIAALAEKYPQTKFWMDSIIEDEITFGLNNASHGVTTAPSVTAHSVEVEPERWKAMAAEIRGEHPEYSEQELLWACMYKASAAAAPRLKGLFNDRGYGMDGHLAIQADIFHFNDPDAIIAQAKVIHSLGKNFIIKIPTTGANLRAMEEIVAGGNSVLATSCASVPQVLAAAEALSRGYERLLASGGSDAGLCLSIAMQLNWQNKSVENYARKHHIPLSENAVTYAAIAVAKKSYKLLKERYPKIDFMLSNLKTDPQIREFIGGDILITIPFATQQKVDGWQMPLENRIDAPIPDGVVEELLEKIPFYTQAYQEDGMKPEEFSAYIPFCKIVNHFLEMYEGALHTIREVIVPNPYGDDAPGAY